MVTMCSRQMSWCVSVSESVHYVNAAADILVIGCLRCYTLWSLMEGGH